MSEDIPVIVLHGAASQHFEGGLARGAEERLVTEQKTFTRPDMEDCFIKYAKLWNVGVRVEEKDRTLSDSGPDYPTLGWYSNLEPFELKM